MLKFNDKIKVPKTKSFGIPLSGFPNIANCKNEYMYFKGYSKYMKDNDGNPVCYVGFNKSSEYGTNGYFRKEDIKLFVDNKVGW